MPMFKRDLALNGSHRVISAVGICTQYGCTQREVATSERELDLWAQTHADRHRASEQGPAPRVWWTDIGDTPESLERERQERRFIEAVVKRGADRPSQRVLAEQWGMSVTRVSALLSGLGLSEPKRPARMPKPEPQPRATPARDTITGALRAAGRPMKVAELIERTGMVTGIAHSNVARMTKEGYIKRISHGVYGIIEV